MISVDDYLRCDFKGFLIIEVGSLFYFKNWGRKGKFSNLFSRQLSILAFKNFIQPLNRI